jgi:hypothetical protein
MSRFYSRHVGSKRSQADDKAPCRARRGRHVDFDQWILELDESSRARFEDFLELVAEAVAGAGAPCGTSAGMNIDWTVR